MNKPMAAVLRADGINRDEELAFAFSIAGANSKIVHINDLRKKNDSLKDYQILALPGGFAYGDDIVSGKILATELTAILAEQLTSFVERKNTALIGICNGFQALIRTGLLPFRSLGTMKATLTNNDSGHFECRWVHVGINKHAACLFLEQLKGETVLFPVAHGEGKFFADNQVLEDIEKNGQVAFRYVSETENTPTQQYPANPNGALHAIAGISDQSGRILGLMPHPECFIEKEQHPNWRRMTIRKPPGLTLFENIVTFVKQA